MAFLDTPRILPKLSLCGSTLLWVGRLKHLGNTIENSINGAQLDTKIKNAIYIQKNISLNQEFYFAHPRTKMKLNCIYNTHFTGSQIWNLFSKEALKLEVHYNRSVKIMCGLPYPTHRYFIEHVTGRPHVKKMLIKRYLKFIKSIEQSPKSSLCKLLKIARSDVRSVTGSNLRNIMLLMNNNTTDLNPEDAIKIEYNMIPEGEEWRLGLLDEILELQHGDLVVPGMDLADISYILDYICTS